MSTSITQWWSRYTAAKHIDAKNRMDSVLPKVRKLRPPEEQDQQRIRHVEGRHGAEHVGRAAVEPVEVAEVDPLIDAREVGPLAGVRRRG